ncbi:NAD(P)H-dependent oxidoreductase [Carboxylicivirga sp. M1479]|uniref:glutathione-regulated potassium-efflux system oxidoreductase KefF n=1 Tax=Carboxylicivirga sp. M1479 TaxID=2594476 RepID=UPI001177564C|nr:NAD(P)H-dependent oxidoreductase [Carboxylicivirga sp. M1479]TRX62804.1 NAD(P)H oxidoreductase [Carboxylicivirga sp. M1479]
MRKVLIVYAHPLEEKSKVNRSLIEGVREMDGVTVNNLYENYPDFFIDVKHEQELLLAHDVIIWHHPLYWYSAPALLKEWFDLVLEHGFAYGQQGDSLAGKWALNCVTTGGGESSYQTSGINRFSIEQFLLPYNQSAHLCKMHYLPPFVIHGVHLLGKLDVNEQQARYRQFIRLLCDESNDFQMINKGNY